MKKVLGIGNALVDVLIKLDDESIFQEFDLPKGGMTLIDKATHSKILAKCEDRIIEYAAGGSAANTINGLANMGTPSGFIGKVGRDRFGDLFRKDMIDNGICPKLLESTTETGLALTFVTPDSERTFATYLGAAVELTPEDICNEDFEGYDYFHIEGFLVQNHGLIRKALQLAKQNGLKVSLDLASFNVVLGDKPFLEEIVAEFVDIIFANEEEAKAFTDCLPYDALLKLSEVADIAVVKVGREGSMIKCEDLVHKIEIFGAAPLDTTGAGDLYAGGVLHGIATNRDLTYSGRLGSLLAGNVVEVYGAKMDQERWNTILETSKTL